MKKLWFVLFPLLLSLLIWGCAAQRQVVQRGLVQTLNQIQAEKYPDANAVVVFDSIRVDLQRSGKYVQREHKLVKILTAQGKENYSEAKTGYFSAYDTVLVTMARVIGRGGTIVDIPANQIKDIPLPAFGKFFLPHVREKIITFPNLVLGSSIEFATKDIMRNPPMENNFDTFLLFEGMDPISCQVFELIVPQGMKIRYLVKNENVRLDFSRESKGDKVIYRWVARDVPRVIREPGMPPLPDVATKLLVTTVPSWKEWSRWCYELASPTFEPGPPDERAIELARVVDRGIRSSGAVDLKKLCIVPGKRAYILFVDVYVLNHDGNLIDASALAALAALTDTKLPGYQIEEDRVILDKSVWSPLPLQDYPVAITFASVGGELVVDPCLDEELAMEAKLTITVDKDGRVCAMQKSGPGSFSAEQVVEAIDIARDKAAELRSMVMG